MNNYFILRKKVSLYSFIASLMYSCVCVHFRRVIVTNLFLWWFCILFDKLQDKNEQLNYILRRKKTKTVTLYSFIALQTYSCVHCSFFSR